MIKTVSSAWQWRSPCFVFVYLYMNICSCIFIFVYLYLWFFLVFICWKRVKSCDKTSLAVCHRWQTLLKGKLPGHQIKVPQVGLIRIIKENNILNIYWNWKLFYPVEWSFFIWAVKPFWVWKIALLLLIFLHLKKTPLCRIFTIFWASV